jgi:hypothetical protein
VALAAAPEDAYRRRFLSIGLPMRPFRSALLCLALLGFSAGAAAEELKTLAGDLTVPDGFFLLERNEEPAEDGSPGGLYVYAREADALPRAIYILSFGKPRPVEGKPLPDTALAAAMMANPMNPEPDAGKSRPVRMGEASGHRHSTTLDNGLISTVYSVDHNGLRFLALLKHPPGRDYKRDTARFEDALKGFRWAPAATPAAEAAAPVAAEAAEPASAATPAETTQAADSGATADAAEAESSATPAQDD